MKRGKTVLLIDDDLKLVKILKDNLHEEGYNVYCGYDGGVALSMAQKVRPDLILLDVDMPHVNGLAAFEKLRGDQKTAQIPIVFITSINSQMLQPVVQYASKAA